MAHGKEGEENEKKTKKKPQKQNKKEGTQKERDKPTFMG
jgi:hypothetical protein